MPGGILRTGVSLRDVPLPLLLLAIGYVGTSQATNNQADWARPDDPLAYVLVTVAALALVLRRRSPGLTLVLCGTAVAGYVMLGYAFGPILFTVPFATYQIGLCWPLRRAVQAGLLFATILCATSLAHFMRTTTDAGLTALLSWTLAWLAAITTPLAVGAAVGTRRASLADVRLEQARRAVSEERLRSAQEVHDVVGHGLAAITMQEGVALHVLDREPGKARESLEAIRATSREALEGLRAELAWLRDPDLPAAPRLSVPGLADVGVLVDRIRAGGLRVSVSMGPLRGVPPEVDAAGYRILQESLTNVLRHAGTTSARVLVTRDGDRLRLEVTDRGPADRQHHTAAFTEGSGLRGMRSRAEALGGTLTAGPRPGGGFTVVAELPIPTLAGSAT